MKWLTNFIHKKLYTHTLTFVERFKSSWTGSVISLLVQPPETEKLSKKLNFLSIYIGNKVKKFIFSNVKQFQIAVAHRKPQFLDYYDAQTWSHMLVDNTIVFVGCGTHLLYSMQYTIWKLLTDALK